jgi:phage-related minor tail protein
MADNFGLKIGVEGEKEFKKALADINSQFKVLGSEMKLATSQFDSNESSVESLTSKNEVLTKQIDAQKEKIETLRKALENASDSFGENDRRTQQWVVALNNAEAELNGMERELSQNEKAIDGMGDKAAEDAAKQTDKLGDELDQTGGQADSNPAASSEARLCRQGRRRQWACCACRHRHGCCRCRQSPRGHDRGSRRLCRRYAHPSPP